MVSFPGYPGLTMSVERIKPAEAAERMSQGWTYVDVRSVEEVAAGHPEGAYNVPFMNKGPRGLSANRDFVEVMSRRFDKDARIILGCKSGGRSLAAAKALVAAGFSQVVDMRGGFSSEVAPSGAVTCAGWQAESLPVSSQLEPGRSYEELSKPE